MPVDSAALVLLVTGVVSLVLLAALFYLLYAYRNTVSQLSQLKSAEHALAAKAQADADKLMTGARMQAERTIEFANGRANAIVSQATTFKAGLEREFSEAMQETIKLQASDYKVALDQAKEEGIKAVQMISQNISAQASKDLDELTQVLSEQSQTAQATVRKKIDEEMNQARAEITRYKQTKLAEAENTIKQVLVDASKRVISRAIDPTEHEELVLEALEEAKRENVF